MKSTRSSIKGSNSLTILMDWSAKWGLKIQSIFPLSFLTACSVVIVYIHNHFTDLTLKVWTSLSLLSYCLIIVLTGWHAWGHETARHRHIDSGRCGLNEGLPVVFSVLLFINLSNTIKDCQQEWQKEEEREEKEERERERERLSPFHRYDSVHAAASKIKLPFSVC